MYTLKLYANLVYELMNDSYHHFALKFVLAVNLTLGDASEILSVKMNIFLNISI
jgi:hypothetical protein